MKILCPAKHGFEAFVSKERDDIIFIMRTLLSKHTSSRVFWNKNIKSILPSVVFLTFSSGFLVSLSSSFAWLFIEKSQEVPTNLPKRAKLAQGNMLLGFEGTHSPR